MATTSPLHQSSGGTGHPANRESTLIAQVRAYKDARRRRLHAIAGERARRQVSRETQEIVDFTQMWTPYCGAPNDEIFLRFGMSAARFSDRLWQAVSDMRCNTQAVQRFAEVYPRQRLLPLPTPHSGHESSSGDE
jgi:hypothetical protein